MGKGTTIKPRSKQRLSDDDDAYWDDEPTLAVGTVTPSSERTSSAISTPVLWIPDPEQWHGWREYYVPRDDTPDKGTVGFKGKA